MSVVFTLVKQLATKDNAHQALNTLQADLVGIMTQLNQSVSSQMQLLTGVSLGTTAKPIAHNLSYECRGFIVVNKTDTFDVYRDTSGAVTNPDPLRYILLKTSAGTHTVSILVF